MRCLFMEEKNNIPFPQANDFKKIIKLLEVDEEKLKDNSYLKDLLDLGTDRQISYYLSACDFLGLISKRSFTAQANNLKYLSNDTKVLKLSQLIVSMPVFGEVFFMRYYFNSNPSIEEISQMISILYKIDNYEVCKRRASTVIKWLSWIEEQKYYYNGN